MNIIPLVSFDWIGPVRVVRLVRLESDDDEEEDDASLAMPAAVADRLRVDDRIGRAVLEVSMVAEEAEASSTEVADGLANVVVVVVVVPFAAGGEEDE